MQVCDLESIFFSLLERMAQTLDAEDRHALDAALILLRETGSMEGQNKTKVQYAYMCCEEQRLALVKALIEF